MSANEDRISSATVNHAVDITSEIYGVSQFPVGYGGYSDIHTGFWRSGAGEMKVAIKVIRAEPMDESDVMPRALRREISVWKRLQHRNVHVMCGLFKGIGPLPALVSPWYKNGDIKSYLRVHRNDSDVNFLKLRLLCDAMCGVRFLHSNSIVHGDIKGLNVLVSDSGVARLCDFGLSRLLIEHSQSVSYPGLRGTSRWMAPEIFLDGERHSYASDMWACGCLFIEVWNNVPPYHTKVGDHQFRLALRRKELPGSRSDIPAMIWTVVQECCSFDATQRPASPQVAACLSLHLVLHRVNHWVTLSRPIDAHMTELLQGIESTIRVSRSKNITELYFSTDSELASDVVRHLALTGIINPQSSQLFPPAVFLWCLARIGIGSLLLPAGVSLPTTDDEDFFDVLVGSHEPAKLRPLARLVERARPGLAKHLMTFSKPALGSPLTIGTPLWSLAWLSDGSRIVTGCMQGKIHILDVATGEALLQRMGHECHVKHVAVSPNQRLVASCSYDKRVRLWDAETGLAIGAVLAGHWEWVHSVAFSPDGRHIVSGSGDATIRIWSIKRCKTVLGPLRGHTETVTSVAYAPDGSRIISGSTDTTVRVWDARTGHSILTIRGHTDLVQSVSYSPDGLHIVSGSNDCTVRLWDATTGQQVGSPLKDTDWVLCVAYSPDGTHIATSSVGHLIHIWDAATGAAVAMIRGHTEWVSSVAFSPDGKRLASASYDGTVRIWDATEDWRRWDI